MKNMALVLALVAVFAAVGAQMPPGYGMPQYSPMNMGYSPMGYPAYSPQSQYNPGYNPGFGGSENSNANSNTNVNSNAGGGSGRWF